MSSSSASKNRKPIQNPTNTGKNCSLPRFSDILIAGIISEKNAAATITPEAKPESAFFVVIFISLLVKKTDAEPSVVPRNGINKLYISALFIALENLEIVLFRVVWVYIKLKSIIFIALRENLLCSLGKICTVFKRERYNYIEVY